MRSVVFFLLLLGSAAAVQPAESVATNQINLETALRLCGANHLELQSARVSLQTAQAKYADTRRKFFPWLMVGANYKRLDGNTQNTPGDITDESKQSYQAGLGIVAELRIGEVMYQSLAAKQRSRAAEHDVDAVRNQVVSQVTLAYYRLLRAQAMMQVNEQSRLLAGDYETQLRAAVKAGVAFEADQLRAQVQSLRHDLMIRKAKEDIEVASAQLCEMLRLPNGLNLRGDSGELVPITLADANASLSTSVTHALNHRPELRSREAMLAAAKTDTEGTLKAPFYPELSVRGNLGGLGGGRNRDTGNFDESSEVVIGLGWRIGPGGLFDSTRSATAKTLEAQEELLAEKTRQRITREVLESVAKVRSLKERIAITEKLLEATEKAYTLTRERGQQGIGGVLETLRSEEDLSFARLAYFDLVTEFNSAQTALRYAMGTSQ